MRVYPRACGGTAAHRGRLDVDEGLSPRVRGNPLLVLSDGGGSGSIPARAGEPRWRIRWPRRRMVYPRACGGTSAPGRTAISWSGLSPRVRGNPAPSHRSATPAGSIPARAGEPCHWVYLRWRDAVYPRACGGTHHGRRSLADAVGLSPRVRGNLVNALADRDAARSIPARAGEPVSGLRQYPRLGVYPRACGGTTRATPVASTQYGLSPRVRGNRSRGREMWLMRRSIPARAGEPERGLACGQYVRGLSPRVRGNRAMVRKSEPPLRSIPARAGEPPSSRKASSAGGVYPRACGGTAWNRRTWPAIPGLSPRVRGNPKPAG